MIRLLPFVLCLIALPVWAGDFGIAMHGAPKYTAPTQVLSYVNKDAPKGGVLRQGVTGSFDTLNPFSLKGRPAQGLDFVFDRLAARAWDEPFSLYGLVAKQIIVPENRDSITFVLNEKAKFHDGVPVTADDIQYTFEQLRDKGRPNMQRVYKLVSKVTTENPHRIRFDLKPEHDRETVMILAMMPVMAKHWWVKHDLGGTILEPPPGTGPYRIVGVDAGRQLILERVKDDWAAGHLMRHGQYNFDRMVFQYFRDDTVALEAFRKGVLDIRRETDIGRWLTNYRDMPRGVTIEDIPHHRPEPARGFIFNLRRPPFNSQAVRKALSLAFDREYLIDTQYAGHAKPITSLFPNSILAANDGSTLRELTRRAALKQADALLNMAGYPVTNGKRAIHFTITLGLPSDEKIALHWARGLKTLGIDVTIRTLDAAQFAGALGSFDYDVVLHQWLNSLSPGSEQLIFWSCDAAKNQGSRNYAGLCLPAVDDAAHAIATTTDYQKLVASTHTLDRLIMNEDVFVPLVYEGVDHLARRSAIKRPDTVPLYGTVIESYWMDKPPAP